MNKKVDEEFKNIHDEYLLQCICTEMKDKIDKAIKILDADTHVENIYYALCNLFDEEYQYEIDNEELNKILKGE